MRVFEEKNYSSVRINRQPIHVRLTFVLQGQPSVALTNLNWTELQCSLVSYNLAADAVKTTRVASILLCPSSSTTAQHQQHSINGNVDIYLMAWLTACILNMNDTDLGRIPFGVFRRLISYAWVTHPPPVFSLIEHSPAVSGQKHGICGHHCGDWP